MIWHNKEISRVAPSSGCVKVHTYNDDSGVFAGGYVVADNTDGIYAMIENGTYFKYKDSSIQNVPLTNNYEYRMIRVKETSGGDYSPDTMSIVADDVELANTIGFKVESIGKNGWSYTYPENETLALRVTTDNESYVDVPVRSMATPGTMFGDKKYAYLKPELMAIGFTEGDADAWSSGACFSQITVSGTTTYYGIKTNTSSIPYGVALICNGEVVENAFFRF
jgi:hypothetical protein